MRATAYFSTGLLLVGSVLGQSPACSSTQQYNTLPGFPASRSGCFPDGYYQTADLGQTSPSDAQTRCQQQCINAGNACSSVVAQVNKAGDSDLYSGTCFFYASARTPTGPRQCADKAFLLLGYVKDNTLGCFSSSLSSASKYCSSYLTVPVVTSTATITPRPTTSTVTVSTSPRITMTVTITVTPTVRVIQSTTTTTTNTVSATSTVTSTLTVRQTTTVSTETSTVTSDTATTTTTTSTSTVTLTSSTILGSGATLRKRQATSVPAPACVTSGTPATRISAACSCLSVKPSTTTTTATAIRSTVTTTTTSTVPVTQTQTVTVTAPPATTTTTTTVTATASTTVTSATTTTTTTSTISVSATATSTTTTTRTSTSTVTTATTTTVTAIATCSQVTVPNGGNALINGNFDTGYVSYSNNPPWQVTGGAGFPVIPTIAQSPAIAGVAVVNSAFSSSTIFQDVTGLIPTIPYVVSVFFRPLDLNPQPSSTSVPQRCEMSITLGSRTLFSRLYTQVNGTQSGYSFVQFNRVILSEADTPNARFTLAYSCPQQYVGDGLARMLFDTTAIRTDAIVQQCGPAVVPGPVITTTTTTITTTTTTTTPTTTAPRITTTIAP